MVKGAGCAAGGAMLGVTRALQQQDLAKLFCQPPTFKIHKEKETSWSCKLRH